MIALIYRGYLDHYVGENGGEVIIELYDHPRQKIRAYYTWEKVSSEMIKVKKKIGKFGTFPPYIVRQTILYALKNGWEPDKGGGLMDLGHLDEKIDYSELQQE